LINLTSNTNNQIVVVTMKIGVITPKSHRFSNVQSLRCNRWAELKCAFLLIVTLMILSFFIS
jgi:hypothetical protein